MSHKECQIKPANYFSVILQLLVFNIISFPCSVNKSNWRLTVEIAQCVQCTVQNFYRQACSCLFIKQTFSLFQSKSQYRIQKNERDGAFSIYGPDNKAFSFLVIVQLIVFSVFLYAAFRSVRHGLPNSFCLTQFVLHF